MFLARLEAVRVRLCKLGTRGTFHASVIWPACDQPSRWREQESSQQQQPVTLCTSHQRRKKAWPAHPHTAGSPPLVCLHSSRLISSRAIAVVTQSRTHARTAPHSTPLPLSSVCLLRRTSATSKAPPRDKHHHRHPERAYRRVTLASLNCNIPLTTRLQQ